MKKTLLFSLLFFCSFYLLSQNYEVIVPNKSYHYTRNYVQHDVLLSVKIDSISDDLGVTKYFNYKQLNIELSNNSFYQYFFSDASYGCLERGSWFSSEIQTENINPSLYILKNNFNQNLFFKTNAVLNEEWTFFTNTSLEVKAIVSDIQEINIFGNLDSVKTITLLTFSNGLPLTSHSFNQKTILLSKNYGIIKAYNFSAFPNDVLEINLVGFENMGVLPLSENELYQFETNDLVVYENSLHTEFENYELTNDFIKVSSDNSANNIISYNTLFLNKDLYGGNTNQYSNNYDWEIPFVASQNFLTGTYNKITSEDLHYTYINYIKSGKRRLKGLGAYTLDDGGCFTEPLDHRFQIDFQEQLGLLKRMENWTSSYFDEWGNEVFDYFNVSKELKFYTSEINVGYGSQLSPFNSYSLTSNINNHRSCTGEFDFYLRDSLWVTSLVWDLGDENTSVDPSIHHVYADSGTYNVSIVLTSPFGDETLNFLPQFQVGMPSSEELFSADVDHISCNEKILNLIANYSDSCSWILPNGNILYTNSINQLFNETGEYLIKLANYYAYCADTIDVNLKIISTQNPIPATIPLTANSGYDFHHFDFNQTQISEIYYDQYYGQLLNACNQFEICRGKEANVQIGLNYYQLIPVGMDLWDPWYTGVSLSLWIDYNNNGYFETSEEILHHQDDEFFGDYNSFINANYSVIISESAILNTPLRMRLVAGFDPNISSGYDFSVIITDKEEAIISEQNGILTATSSSTFYNTFSWLNCDSGAVIAGENNTFFQPTIDGNYALVMSNEECSDTSNCLNFLQTASLKTMQNSKFDIYPNPNEGKFFITIPDFSDSYIELTDIIGQQILNFRIIETMNTNIDISLLKSGVYIVNIYKDNILIGTEKIIKK